MFAKLILFSLLAQPSLSNLEQNRFHFFQSETYTVIRNSMGREGTSHQELLKTQKQDSIILLAEQFLGRPYIWGGTTPTGFDCSGFVQYIYAGFGYTIPRVSGDQVMYGSEVDYKEAQKGDLVYYGYKYNNSYIYTHTAMVHSNKDGVVYVIHSILPGLSITPLHFDQRYSTQLICIKRIIS